MGLSVIRVSLGEFLDKSKNNTPRLKRTDVKNSPEIPSSTSTTTGADLNKHPNALYFKGKAERPRYNGSGERVYGPYLLTQEELEQNDKNAQRIVDYLGECMSQGSKDTKGDPYGFPYRRAANETVEKMVPVCIALFTYHDDTPTTFPKFYDTITRAFPKACSKADKRLRSDNTARLYEKTTEKINELGYIADPKTKNPLRDGIAYIYFADDMPAIIDDKKHYSVQNTIEDMRNGNVPKIGTGTVYPRCHMSQVPDEIMEYGTKTLRKKYGEMSGGKKGIISSNIWGMKKNGNNTKWRFTPEEEAALLEWERKCAEIDKPKEPLGIDLEEFVGEMLRGTF